MSRVVASPTESIIQRLGWVALLLVQVREVRDGGIWRGAHTRRLKLWGLSWVAGCEEEAGREDAMRRGTEAGKRGGVGQ